MYQSPVLICLSWFNDSINYFMFRHSWSIYAIDITNDLFKIAIKFCQIESTARSTSSEIKIGKINDWVLSCTILLRIICKKLGEIKIWLYKKVVTIKPICKEISLEYFGFSSDMSISQHGLTNSEIWFPKLSLEFQTFF